jgi:hypothetical protein
MEHGISILFFVKKKKSKEENVAPVYMRIAVNGARLEQTTNRMVDLVPISIKWLLHYGMVFLHNSIE